MENLEYRYEVLLTALKRIAEGREDDSMYEYRDIAEAALERVIPKNVKGGDLYEAAYPKE